jgi:hypothetical protein
MTPQQFVDLLITNILNPLLYVLFAAAMIVFLYGVVQFIWGLSIGATDDPKKDGKMHMLFGLIGLFIMLTAFSIIGLVVNTFFPGKWPPPQSSYPTTDQIIQKGGT